MSKLEALLSLEKYSVNVEGDLNFDWLPLQPTYKEEMQKFVD